MAAAESDHKHYTAEDLKDLKVALVHYWLVTWRGGEKVVESLLKLLPNADVYTLFYDKNVCGPYLSNHRVYTSCLNLPGLRKQYQKLFPFYPLGIESLRLRQTYDLILSSESGPAKGIANPEGVPHLCYVHTPMRYCWGFTDAYLQVLPSWSRNIAAGQFKRLQQWDRTTVNNVDLYVANSNNVANRVKQYYGKQAEICFPPISLDLFQTKPQRKPGEFFLSFGALTPYKNIALLVETFNDLDEPLVVIGDGSERAKLERAANRNIRFLGSLSNADVLSYIQRSRALLFPGEEDFGMIPLEVMSQGVPVIAYQKGGALETVVENPSNYTQSTGIFFKDDTIECLKKAIHRFIKIESEFDPAWIAHHARSFGEDRFQEEMTQHILGLLNR